MAGLTQVDLDGLARRKRVRSLHRWFDVLKRSISKPGILEDNGSGSAKARR